MSKYTTEVRYICENYANQTESKGYNSVQSILNASWDKVFDFDFPIFDENYREPLCKKILKHFYTREISEETVGLWKLRLDDRMNEIMPYYNQLYESELISISPLINYRVTTSGNKSKMGQDSVGENGQTSETDTINGTVVRTGGYTDTHDGTDTLEKKGTETLTKDGTETIEKSGKVLDKKLGQYTDEKTGVGNKIQEYDGQDGTLVTENVDLFTDTPQGNIANMGTNYGTSSNPSDVPIVGDDTAYLTTAEKTKETQTDGRNWIKKDGWDEDYKENTTRIYGDYSGETPVPLTNEKEYEDYKDEKTFDDRTDTTSFDQRKDVQTKDLEDKRVYNSQTDTTNNSKQIYGTANKSKTMTYGNTNTYLDSVLGSKGKSDSALLKEFRETFLNIDLMVIHELDDLFLNLW